MKSELRHTGFKRICTQVQFCAASKPDIEAISLSKIFVLISILMALTVCGCSAVQTIDLSPDELQEQIAKGQLVKPGDHLTVITNQGTRYEIEITRVTEQSIEGLENQITSQQTIDENANVSVQTVDRNAVEISIAEISAIETRELTPVGEVAGATGAAVVVGGFMYFIYIILPALLVGAIVGL